MVNVTDFNQVKAVREHFVSKEYLDQKDFDIREESLREILTDEQQIQYELAIYTIFKLDDVGLVLKSEQFSIRCLIALLSLGLVGAVALVGYLSWNMFHML